MSAAEAEAAADDAAVINGARATTTQEESNTVGTSGTAMVSEETRSGEVEHSAHTTAVEGGTESEQPKHGASMSEDESMRTTQEISTVTHQAEEDTNNAWNADDEGSEGDKGAGAAAPRRSDEDIDNDTIGIGMGGPTEENPQGSGVKPGYEGRARRGASKPPGGYDETPKRRGPRKRTGVRIRYVDDDERGGGTTEQGIRMGPVSVWRVAHGHRSEAKKKSAPTPDVHQTPFPTLIPASAGG